MAEHVKPPTPGPALGHYGVAAWIIALAGILALVLHLAVPYGNMTYEEEGVESETLKRSDVSDNDAFGGESVGAAKPGVTLAGTIMMAVAGVALLATSYVRLPMVAARLLGWSSGLVAAVGGFMAFMSSMFWVGDGMGVGAFAPMLGGFSGLLDLLLLGSERVGFLWALSPLFVAILAAASVLAALHLCKNVVASRDGYRDRAKTHLMGGVWALLFLGLVLLLPWAHVKAETGNAEDTEDWYAIGAHSVLYTNQLTEDSPEPFWGGLAFGIKVMIATAWIGLAFALVGSLGGVLASIGAPSGLPRVTHFAVVPVAIMLLWSFVHYILAWTHQWKPFDEAEDVLPGFWPGLVVVAYVLWVLTTIRIARGLIAAGGGAPSGFKPVRFD